MRLAPALQMPDWPVVWPGILTAITIALAATFVSEHQGGPQLLYALFFGMAFNFAANGEKVKAGIEFASRQILRFGVALLGARITAEQISGLGTVPILLVIVGVVLTILFGALVGRLLGRPRTEGLLTGGAVAICGASAALAISAVMPKNEENQRFTLFTVVGVTTLSTLAMIAYPAIARAFDLDPGAASVFLGGTIHDVAQVVAAGYMISPEVGDGATFVKLLRVAMLLPVILVAGQITRAQAAPGTTRPPLLPWFVVAFAALVALNSVVSLPKGVTQAGNDLSRWCLVTSLAAIGMKTRLGAVVRLGLKPVILMFIETFLLAAMVIGVLKAGLV